MGFLRSFSVVLFMLPLLFVQMAYGDINAELFQAADAGNTAKVKQLLRQGADVNPVDRRGWTVLKDAVLKGNTEIVNVLIGAGADVNVKGVYGDTALGTAAGRGHTEIVKALIEAGADVNAKDKTGMSTLMAAVYMNKTDTAKALIDAGVDVSAKDNAGQTALTYAAVSGRTETLKVLIEAGADANAKMPDGRTALMAIVRIGDTEIVKALIAAGADVNAKDDDSATALTIALRGGHFEIADILRQAGAQPETTANGDFNTVLIGIVFLILAVIIFGIAARKKTSDLKHHKSREIKIYYSLIFAAGTGFALMLYPLSLLVFWPFFLVAFPAIFFFSVWGFFTCSRLLRVHLLLWYGCLILLILILPSFVPAKTAHYILFFGIPFLLILPVIWVRYASRS